MSKKVDFYIINADDTKGRDLYLCQLIEKTHQQKQRIFINAQDNAQEYFSHQDGAHHRHLYVCPRDPTTMAEIIRRGFSHDCISPSSF